MSGVKMLASSPMLMFLLSLLMASFFDTTAGQIGVCYGRVGNNLPSPSEVVAMYKKYNFQRMRIYDPNPNVLDALRGTNIELILDIPNSDLAGIASSQTVANTWVQNHVKNYDGVSFKYISVGNEVKPDGPGGAGNFLAQAMQNIDKSLSEAGLSNIKVSTTTYMGAFVDTYPPSNGKFNVTYLSFLQRAIDFLESKRYPLLVNIYTYFSFKDDSDNNPLEYALFQPNNKQFDDYPHHYNNLFDASLDSVYAALEKSGGGSLEVVVSESGWPTQGGKGTSVENAKTYVNNLIQHVKKGSPRTRGKPIETYIFAMFNENNKTPEYEKYWGLFLPDKQPQYEVIFD